jgi:hypothetical protein
MACVDIDLCDKIDSLNTILTQSYDVQGQTFATIDTISQDIQILKQADFLILGFLAWFLFFIIIKLFLNFFNKMLSI